MALWTKEVLNPDRRDSVEETDMQAMPAASFIQDNLERGGYPTARG